MTRSSSLRVLDFGEKYKLVRYGDNPIGSMVSLPSHMRIVAWLDPAIDAKGFDTRSLYVERYWLPVLGPSATWLVRKLSEVLTPTRSESERVVELSHLAHSIGLGSPSGPKSPFKRALERLVIFGAAKLMPGNTLAVRKKLPPLSTRQVARLGYPLSQEHAKDFQSYLQTNRQPLSLRASALAKCLLETGDSFDQAERQLLLWGFHPSVAHEALMNCIS